MTRIGMRSLAFEIDAADVGDDANEHEDGEDSDADDDDDEIEQKESVLVTESV